MENSTLDKLTIINHKPMTKKEIIEWMIDAHVMIGEKNDEGEDEGKCL